MTLDIDKIKQQLNKTITKRVDKKEFINDLKAIPTNYVEIMFCKDTNQVIIKQPQGSKYICHIARN